MFSNCHNLIVTDGTFVYNHQMTTNAYRLLTEAASPRAFHDSGHLLDPPRCHENTRVAVLNKIKNWIRQDSESVMWLHGGAGAGKSAIARSIAEWCQQERLLLSSFFFWRSDPTRNHIKAFLATIAYGITQNFVPTRRLIELAVEDDPHIFTRSLDSQFAKLIYEPLKYWLADYPLVLIVDGLDECLDRDEQRALLTLLASCVCKYHLPWKIFIASRKEKAISLSFDRDPLINMTIPLALSAQYSSASDIRRFFTDKIAEIKQNHPLKKYLHDWPDTDDIDEIVSKSSQQFIFPATVIRYIQSERHSPRDRLKLVLHPNSHGFSSTSNLPFAELDQLYTQIFSSIDVDHGHLAPRIVAFIIIANHYISDPASVAEIAFTFGIAAENVDLILGELGSILEEGPSYRGGYSILHASLEDFLSDRYRCKELWVNWDLVRIDLLRFLTNRCSIYYVSEGIVVLDDLKATQDVCQQVISAIDIESLTQFYVWGCSDIRLAGEVYWFYLNYLRKLLPILGDDDFYERQKLTIFQGLADNHFDVISVCLHVIKFEVCVDGSADICSMPYDCIMDECDRVECSRSHIDPILDLFQDHLFGFLEGIDISSAIIRLIHYVTSTPQSHNHGTFYLRRRPSRKLRPWLWKNRTSRKRFQAERNGWWRILTAHRRFRRATAHAVICSTWPYCRGGDDSCVWKIPGIRNIVLAYEQAWDPPYDLCAEVRRARRCSESEHYWDPDGSHHSESWRHCRKHLGHEQKTHLGPKLLSIGHATREALRAIPRALDQYPKIQELITILSSDLIFSQIAFIFVKDLRRCKRAIARYLRPTAPLPSRS